MLRKYRILSQLAKQGIENVCNMYLGRTRQSKDIRSGLFWNYWVSLVENNNTNL